MFRKSSNAVTSDLESSIGVNLDREKSRPVKLTKVSSLETNEHLSVRGYNEGGGEIDKTEDVAIAIRGAYKSYTKGVPVLAGLDMTVPCGYIYGLLGSSGCGKSTLLSCIIGIRKLDHGYISLYGTRPGSSKSRAIGIPGRNIGYMPQDICLYQEFQIKEMFRYFGIFCGLSFAEIDSSHRFLEELLQLPKGSRLIGSLSGGQVRRVSFACALLHNPKLIVLDEPTVGVDPILRQKIWDHLKTLVASQGTTVLVTTHYLDEARHADRIGVMRDGTLLAEDSPQRLLASCNVSSLEEAVLTLCKQERRHQVVVHNSELEGPKERYPKMASLEANSEGMIRSSMNRVTALTVANYTVTTRNLMLIFFIIISPTFFVSIACLSFGQEPRNLKVGVVNNELDSFENPANCSRISEDNSLQVHENLCDNARVLSCRFLQSIPSGSLQIVQYQSEEGALKAVEEGVTWGLIVFRENFSQAFQDRAMFGAFAEEEVFNASSITVRFDESNKVISWSLRVTLFKGLYNFAKSLLSSCGLDSESVQLPLNFKKPVMGKPDLDMRVFVAIPAGLASIFFFPVLSAGIRILQERHSGMLERSLISGMRMWEFSFTYLIFESINIIIQVALKLVVLIFVFKMENQGNLIYTFLLLFLSGFGGLSMGLLLGSMCREKIEIALLGMGFLVPNVTLSGILWPIEGMPLILHDVVKVLPCTLSAEAIRSVFNRGWEFTHPLVWPGFVVLAVYIVLFNILTLLYHKYLKR